MASEINEDELDLSLKKKKKKPIKMVDEIPAEAEEKKEEKAEEEDDLDLTMKKKKKKKKVNLELDEPEEAAEVAPPDDDDDLQLGKKKKKKKVQFTQDDGIAAPPVPVKVPESIRGAEQPMISKDSTGSDRDYTYDELLERVFKIMQEKNPNLIKGESRVVMKPPQIVKAGAKKTAYANFAETCAQLKRQPRHLVQFIEAELGTNGNIDSANQFILKGRWQQKHMETVLRAYIKEYVICHTCKSADTTLQRDTRLDFLQCQVCGSRCSVAAIKTGFHAQIGKRAHERAKKM